jgi:hypothetical protein
MSELTITSSYVHSRVDSNTFIMSNPFARVDLNPNARADFILPVMDLGFVVRPGNWFPELNPLSRLVLSGLPCPLCPVSLHSKCVFVPSKCVFAHFTAGAFSLTSHEVCPCSLPSKCVVAHFSASVFLLTSQQVCSCSLLSRVRACSLRIR